YSPNLLTVVYRQERSRKSIYTSVASSETSYFPIGSRHPSPGFPKFSDAIKLSHSSSKLGSREDPSLVIQKRGTGGLGSTKGILPLLMLKATICGAHSQKPGSNLSRGTMA